MSKTKQEFENYETLVADFAKGVAEGLGKDAEVKHGRQNRWKGQSGCEHQIDVSVELVDRIEFYECKRLSKKVLPEHVLTLFGRISDIEPTVAKPIVGHVITSKGFGPGAELLGKHFGLRCDIVRLNATGALKLDNTIVVKVGPAIETS